MFGEAGVNIANMAVSRTKEGVEGADGVLDRLGAAGPRRASGRPASTTPASSHLAELPGLGARGEGWVALQAVLMAGVVVAGLLGRGWPERSASTLLALSGVALAAGGAVVVVAAAQALGRGLTPFPKPSGAVGIVERGPYRVVRHPMYAAGSLFFTGYSLALARGSPRSPPPSSSCGGWEGAGRGTFLLAAEPGTRATGSGFATGSCRSSTDGR